MNQEIIVSVIVPVYKVERYLPMCVESLLKQTYAHLEIILIDDGSPDDCPAICERYAKQDARIKVLHEENSGLSAARNFAFQEATGKYVLFVDSDDMLTPEACEILVGQAELENADVVDTCKVSVYETKSGELSEERVEQKLAREEKVLPGLQYMWNQMNKGSWLFIVCGRLYRSDFLREHGFRFPLDTIYEDVSWTMAVFLKAEKVAQCDMTTYVYRVRDGSIVHAGYQGAVRRARDYMDKVIPAVIRLTASLDRKFKQKLMHRLLNECMTDLIATQDYFVQHRDELKVNMFFPLIEKRYWLWLILLNIDIRLFRFFWRLRGRL